jgi:hypothetical protein
MSESLILLIGQGTVLLPTHGMNYCIRSCTTHRLKQILSEKAGLGICADASHVSDRHVPTAVCCEAVIDDFSTDANGDVNLLLHDGRRFDIPDAQPLNGVENCIWRAQVAWRSSEPISDEDKEGMRELLEAMYRSFEREDEIDPEKFSDPEWVSWRYSHFLKSLTTQQMLDLLAEDRLIGRMRRYLAALIQLSHPECEYVAFTEDGRPTGRDEYLSKPFK